MSERCWNSVPDMAKGYLCLHRCELSDDQRAVVLGSTGGKYEVAAMAPALRSCFPEYRDPKLSRRSHGVFVSEMPQEMVEEEVHDEEDSSDDLGDVEKYLNEDDQSDFVWRKTRSERCWHRRENKTGKKFHGKTSSKGWKPIETDVSSCDAKIGAEVEELKLRPKCNRCGIVGHWARECSQKRAQSYKEGGRGNYPVRKLILFQESREGRSLLRLEPRVRAAFSVFFESKHCSMLEGSVDSVSSAVRCWRKRENREWSVIVSMVSTRQC